MIARDHLLKVSGVTKTIIDEFGTKNKILENISFNINGSSPKVTSVLAPFGGGKSTLLRILAGIVKQTEGDVILNGEKYLQATGKIVLIPEKPASLPWLNVRKNIELACGLETCRKNEGSSYVNDVIAAVGLSGYENHFPNNNSLGFRFRISLARALMFDPVVLLLDDCFKEMDVSAREEIYALLESVSKKNDIYFLLATTNIIEAIRLSGRILLMSKAPGRIYKEISVSEKFFSGYKDNKFIEYRKLIEEAYLEEKQFESINFSI